MSSPFFTDEHGMSFGVRFTSEDIPCLPCKVSVLSAMMKRALRPHFHATFGLRLDLCITTEGTDGQSDMSLSRLGLSCLKLTPDISETYMCRLRGGNFQVAVLSLESSECVVVRTALRSVKEQTDYVAIDEAHCIEQWLVFYDDNFFMHMFAFGLLLL